MLVLKGSIETQPVEFDGKIYGGEGDALYSETLEGLIDLLNASGALPLKVGEKLSIEAVEMAEDEFSSIPDCDGE